MINRAAVLLRYREPAVRWINEADPYAEYSGIGLENVNRERTVYLIRDEDADDEEVFQRWLSSSYKMLFENELSGWYTDERLWPENRTMSLFREWFDVECHTVIEDTVGLPIVDDET